MPSTLYTDEELFYAIKFRYKIGARWLYERYACSLYKIILAHVQCPVKASVLLEETFLKIWTDIDHCNINNCRFSVWVMGTARAVIKNTAVTEENTPVSVNSNYIPLKADFLGNWANLGMRQPA